MDMLKMLRLALGDNKEPYAYADEELAVFLSMAANAYSKYNPAKRRGVIKAVKGVREYRLPDDYQTWTDGFSGHEVNDDIVLLRNIPVIDYEIDFVYLANRQLTEIPQRDYPLIVDYGFYCVISGQIKEQSEISSLKLGQGLQIQFGNVTELEKLAESKLRNFNENLAGAFGGWA